MPRVISCQSPEEFEQHLGGKQSFGAATGVVVDFTASWCGPCKMFGPIFEAMSDNYPTVTFLKVDVDDLQEVAQKCSIRSMPTCQAFVNAAKVDEFVGADRAKLSAMLDKVAGMVASSGAGAGRKLGGDSAAPVAAAGPSGGATDEAAERRARMAAAADARAKAGATS